MRKLTRGCVESRVLGLALVALFFTGCSTMSISNAGYRGSWGSRSYNDLYNGELSEFSVLGAAETEQEGSGDIAAAFEDKESLAIPKGAPVLLIQSGAMFPDEGMMEALKPHLQVTPFSGIPPKPDDPTDYSQSLRRTAAKGGLDYILCYWGVLETAQKDLATKTVSWVPIVGRALPDEKQEMRIRLKLVAIDVRTGKWAMVAPNPIGDTATSARVARRNSHEAQVAVLKDAGYKALSESFVENCVHE